MSFEGFVAFLERIEEGEHWELMDGIPVPRRPLTSHDRMIHRNLSRIILEEWQLVDAPAREAAFPVLRWHDRTRHVPVPALAVLTETDAASSCLVYADILRREDYVRMPDGRSWPHHKRAVAMEHPSCRIIVEIHSWEHRIQIGTCDAGNWQFATYGQPGSMVLLPGGGRALQLQAFYAGVSL